MSDSGMGPRRPDLGRQKPPREYTRREVMTKVLATSAAAVATIGTGVWLTGRESARGAELLSIPDRRVGRSAGAVQMAVARSKDPVANVRSVLEALGGMRRFVSAGDRVLVKPNVGWNRLPEQAANTNPQVVAEVVRHVRAAGAAEVWVTDVTVNNAERCFARSGIGEAARQAGAKVVLPSKSGFRTVAVGGELLRVADVLWPFIEADKLINVPVVKQHGSAGATMAMKNWYGVLGGHRVRLHQDLDRSIFELARLMKPTLTILDATRVLVANGPSGGSLDDVRRHDIIAAGVDEVALDAFGAPLLGLSSADLGYLTLGEQAGLGTRDYKRLKLIETTG